MVSVAHNRMVKSVIQTSSCVVSCWSPTKFFKRFKPCDLNGKNLKKTEFQIPKKDAYAKRAVKIFTVYVCVHVCIGQKYMFL